MSDGLHAELTRRIIGAAMEVHRVLGSGLDEKIYENALCVELSLLQIAFAQQSQHLIAYLRLTGLQVGLLLNFENASLQFKRITVSKSKSA